MMGDFWCSLNTLSRKLSLEWQQLCQRDVVSSSTRIKNYEDREEVMRRIEYVLLQLANSISKLEVPVISYNSRSTWDNVTFESTTGFELTKDRKISQVKFDSSQSVKKFGLLVKLLSVVYKLIQQNKFCTKRDLYYQNPELFGTQSTLDNLVENLACLLETPRWELHVLATCKGSVAGDLHFYDDQGHLIDCKSTRVGVQIPAHVKDMQNLSSNARFILVIEKDATFQKLLGDNFCEKFGPCVLITGKGFPDLGTRLLVKSIWEKYQLPIFCLVDADPHGVEIMSVYRFGSKAQAAENRYLAVPSIRWLGILPTDIERLNIPRSVCIAFSKKDYNKVAELLTRPYAKENSHIMQQIQQMEASGLKAEIQCLDSIFSSYLSCVYLPSKLRQGDWI